MDIATLGLAVDSREVVGASADLDRLTAASKKAESAASGFGKGAEDAAKRASAANDNAARSAEKVANSYGKWEQVATRVARAVGLVAGALATNALFSYADAWSDMQSRVGAAIKDMDAAPALMQRIVDIANASYSPLDQTVEVYSRNVAVLRDLGRGATEAADFTEALNHALVVTATRGERAASVQNALSKAMAVGKLQADGLETVLANGGRVAEALAAQLGTNVNGLRKFASQGKITGDVIASALIGNLERLRAEAAEMPATIADAFTRMQTNLTAFVGQLDKTVGASETVAGALLALADNIGRVVTTAATAITAFGTYYVAAMAAAYLSTVTLSGALVFLRAALLRTGIGIAVVAAGELVYQLGRLVEATGSWGGAMQEVGRRAEILLDAVVWGFRMAGDTISSIWAGAMADILRTTEENFGGILRLLGVSAEGMGASITRLEQRAANMGEAAKISGEIAAIQFKRAFEAISLPDGGISDTPGVRAPTVPDVDKAAQKAAKAYKKIVEGAEQFIRAQELELRALGMSARQAAVARHEQDLLNQAYQAGIKVTEDKAVALGRLAERMADAELATKAAKETQDAFNEAGNSAGGWLRGLIDRTKSFKDSLLDLIPIVLKFMNSLNIAGGGKGIFGGGAFQSFLGGLLGIGFQSGGYTGAGAASQPAGIVHAGEYVMSKSAVDRLGVGYLDALHNAAKGYQMGGYVRSYAPANLNMRGYQAGGYVQRHSGGSEALKIELVSRFDADGGFESAVERSSRPVAMQESAKAAGQVARAVPSMALGAMDAQRTRRTRAISPGGGL